MGITNKLRPLLHRKIWETVVPCLAASAAGGFIVSDKYDLNNMARIVAVQGASNIYLYQGENDGWLQLPNSGIAGTFAAGSCGEYRGMGAMGGVFTQTATAGSTTGLTTNRTITRCLAGSRIRVIAGAGAGYDGTVASNTKGANAAVTVTPASTVAFDATTQYQIYSGSLWFMNAGTSAVGFSVYDFATNSWTARSVTNLPTAWGTDGQLVSTIGAASSFATGTSKGTNTSTTLSNTDKTWSTNMWANYQVRITAGTGIGQIRTVASNTATALTVSSAWTVTPDATSVYSIEGNDDYFYLLGNNAVAMYRFSVSGNAWTQLSPTAARAGAIGAGGTADWIDEVAEWAGNETQVAHYSTTLYRQNGRYIYSFRGGATSTLDVYDIAANTWISGVAYGNQNETFTTGSCSADQDGHVYIAKEATGRIFDFYVGRNKMEPYTLNPMQAALGGTAVTGDKLALLTFSDGGDEVSFLYQLRHSGTEFNRALMF